MDERREGSRIEGVRRLRNHLIAAGRRRIGAIGAQEQESAATARMRLEGYRLALADAGLPYDPALVAPAPRYHASFSSSRRVNPDRVRL